MITTTNTVQGYANVGAQGDVHGDVNFYQVEADASPEVQFTVGVRYLDARMPGEARELIERAVARGYETDEVRFHRLLARLSGRTLRELSPEDIAALSAICGDMPPLGRGDEWTAGLRAVLRLMGSIGTTDTDIAVKQLDDLHPVQRGKVLDHLGSLIEGPMVDQLWQRSIAQARANQMAGDRMNRVWMFFEPNPAGARAREVRPNATRVRDWAGAIIGTAALLYAMGVVGRLLLQRGDPAAMAALVLAAAGGAVAMVHAVPWHFARARLRMKDAVLAPPRQRVAEAPERGFARAVDRLVDHYFARYVPDGSDRDTWLAQTAGIKRHLRDELVEIYREQRIKARQIAWLVRHLVGDVRSRWEKDTLTAYRAHLRTPLRIKAACLAGIAVALVAVTGWVVPAAVVTAPWAGTAAALLAAVCVVVATRAWLRITTERRRVVADVVERAEELEAREVAYLRWKAKLSRRPTDPEMASWLECDRKLLVDRMLALYRLKPSQIIAHTFIEAPGTPRERARLIRGPWRYTNYRLLLFLLTQSGVRHASVDLDFRAAQSRPTARMSFRFDAVAAAHVQGLAARQRQTFELTLVSGEHIDVEVTEPPTADIKDGEDVSTLSRVAVDASGLTHTLNVLEGIAAEGKEWARHQRARTEGRLDDLAATIKGLID
ncbi:hypothetical protein [Couchioplanes caeruleus]|uniref:Uncharacterized protein n=2 Tax=Couchioplanes caeruleus TaxID=56438 RepID=A0A1K0GZA9_9ACTN|nr:hypothetical protein [Couchioplanes caeruleus]OJF14763.1 hypothetical protein BG844_08010 [Couchioplanes caeruleus subsp. caeruleus]ROP28086.1 hypothetical protein EDD30_0793 [Couchioplanes caeruleus]